MKLAERPSLRDPRYAEIVDGKEPSWFVLEVHAPAQASVAAELAQRRFGIYIPEVEETVVSRGRKIERRAPMFSGYIFVFMWFTWDHFSWIVNTNGVVDLVGKLTDAEIDIVRAMENTKRPIYIEMPVLEAIEQEPVKPKSKKKRRWKNRKGAKAKAPARPKLITEADLRAEIVTTRAWSAFDDVLQLDSEGRNQTLMRALGLS
jgi:transcriptional antiterminator NusG